MISFPKSVQQLYEPKASIRAGGTDLQERRRNGLDWRPVVDLRDVQNLNKIETDSTGSLLIGAMLRIQQLAANPVINKNYVGLAQAANGLATPAIRRIATVAGNLLQHVRCPYYRNGDFHCFQDGGNDCPSRNGDHLYQAAIDLGPCIAPHPSTLALGFLVWNASILINDGTEMAIEELYGDGSNPSQVHRLPVGKVMTHLRLPAVTSTEKSSWLRVSSRQLSDWPLVEVIVRLQMDGLYIRRAAIAMGGVANVPLRIGVVERLLEGQKASESVFVKVSEVIEKLAKPLPMTRYKVPLMQSVLNDALVAAMGE